MIDRLKSIIYKSRYVTEFIASMVFIFFLALTIYTKVFDGFFHKMYLVGLFIWGILLIVNLVYNFKNSRKKIENIFLNIAIPIGLLYFTFMIPGHVPDEATHFFKSYDLSCRTFCNSFR